MAITNSSKPCHCERVAGRILQRSNLIAVHVDEVASSPSRTNPYAPRNDMVFIILKTSAWFKS